MGKKLVFGAQPSPQSVPALPPPPAPAPEHPNPPQTAVGDPPPVSEAPRTFEECVKLICTPRQAQIEKQQLWASLAQAYALKLVADKLDTLTEYLGAYDSGDDPEEDDPRLYNAIAEGVLAAADIIKDDIMEHPLVKAAIGQAMSELAKHNAESDAVKR